MDTIDGSILQGTQLNGVLGGGPTLTTGVHGNALRFDGLDDYVDLEGPNNTCIADIRLCPQGLTVSFWMLPLSSTSKDGFDQFIVATMFDGLTALGFSVLYPVAQYPFVSIRTDTQFVGCGTEIVQGVGEWFHFAFVWYNTGVTLYNNGIKIKDCGLIADSYTDPLSGLTLGANPLIKSGGRMLNASLDDLYMFEYSLNEEQIYRLYRESFV